MEESRNFSIPTLIPEKYNACKWLESISIGKFPSASELGETLVGREPYIVAFSNNKNRYVVFFNLIYGSLEESNQDLFSKDLRENTNILSAPMRRNMTRQIRKNLSKLTKVELKKMCKEKNINKYSELTKAQIVDLLIEKLRDY